ncbi:MAG: F0F1 ATP synthase subunit A [Chloroflexota bacterium]|nr:F0F1 ATP synthase subunit A [Chloroflexota bacterium]
MGGLLRKPKVLVGLVAVLLLLVGGFLYRGPMAEISLPAERVAHIFGFPLTNTILAAWLTIIVLATLSYFGLRRMSLVPSGLQNLLEAVVEMFLGLAQGVAGKKHGRRFFPLVTTIFLFIVISNWMGLLPGFGTIGLMEPSHKAEEHGTPYRMVKMGGIDVALVTPVGEKAEKHGENESTSKGVLKPFLRSANTDINTPLALALVAVVMVEYWGISTLGLSTYGSRFFNIGRILRRDFFNGFVDFFVGALELVSEMARIISFTFRLFGNIFAGEVLLAVMGFLIPWVAILPFFGLELFVGFIQAFIFAMLTLVFGVIAVAGHGDEKHQEKTKEG